MMLADIGDLVKLQHQSESERVSNDDLSKRIEDSQCGSLAGACGFIERKSRWN